MKAKERYAIAALACKYHYDMMCDYDYEITEEQRQELNNLVTAHLHFCKLAGVRYKFEPKKLTKKEIKEHNNSIKKRRGDEWYDDEQ